MAKASIRFGCRSVFSVYDGLADEKWAVGADRRRGSAKGAQKTTVVPAHDFAPVALQSDQPLAPGAYRLNVKNHRQRPNPTERAFDFGDALAHRGARRTRTGLNTAEVKYAPLLRRRLGIGWVRFENLKWPMVSRPRPANIKFDGVAPWNVPHDDGFRDLSPKRDQRFCRFCFSRPISPPPRPPTPNAKTPTRPKI